MSTLKKATELEFLQYFYANADFGPADEDVKNIIKEDFIQHKRKQLPEGYEVNE